MSRKSKFMNEIKINEVKSDAHKMFANYGHDCTLDDISDNYDWNYAPGFSLLKKIQRWFVRLRVVSESSKLYTHHLRSFGAISAERRRQLKYHPYTIHPFSTGRIVWAIIMMVIILYQLTVTPFLFLLFDFKKENFAYSGILNAFRLYFDTLLLFNIPVNCLTGYYDEPMQKVVLDVKLISIHYLKTNFLLDLVSSFPTYYDIFIHMSISSKASLLWFTIFRFLLVIQFSRYSRMVANHFNINHFTYMTTMVIFYTVIFWHVMCCVVVFIRNHILLHADLSKPLFSTKIVPNSAQAITDNRVWVMYFGALHHKSLLLYNSGYGKAEPVSELEIVLIYCVWYGSSLFCIYILAMIMEINTGKTSSAHKYDSMERQLKEYMRHKQLPAPMRTRILTYYEFKFQKRYFRESEILATISEQLRQEMNMHACKKLVENVIFFRNLPLNLLVRIISCLRIEVFLVNDVIIRANTPGASMYFISTGTVAIYTKSGKEVCHLEDGAHFGEIALLIKDTFRIASVIAVEVSEIYRLDQKDFVKAINPYPDLLANIQHIAEERMEVSSMLDEYNRREIASKRFNLLNQ
ncbi:potassium/sodium hyperpolarization-activated cyclic nucleotide-gated channel 1 isoform X1 [Leptinotarsa decemlineata]|uniref:potassium/sodium hyperpolarization-activated cyclic nucleotide-gated channel 1 isoform X1 n=1 Tax=Leptinotarsa decemlineata TaxID=7539 RepID=UPI000C2546FB|nr:potassium/sodium hyperpolarization-activated cyclic nucleotide-gated channel 1-like [Leptinotarsa decemlineata]